MNTIEQDFEYCKMVIKSCNSSSQIYYIDLLIVEFSAKWVVKVNITETIFQDLLGKLRYEKEKKFKSLS
jgi:hypothetical protein